MGIQSYLRDEATIAVVTIEVDVLTYHRVAYFFNIQCK